MGGRERRLGEGGAMIMGGGDQGAMIMRMLANPNVLTEAGISEDQANKLKAALKEIEIKMIDLEAEIKKASLEQTEHMAKLLSETPVSSKNLMDIVEKIGELRTEQAKLQIKRLIVIREILTPDQIAKVRASARANIERMRGGDQDRRNEGEAAAAQRGFRGREGGREGGREQPAAGGREGKGPAAPRPARPDGWGD